MSHILVIDDEPNLSRLLSRVLRNAGFRTTEAGSGSAGLAAASSLNPDLIILDLMLPDVRGEHVLLELSDRRPESPVLVLSSKTQISTRVRVLDSGAVDYMAKPFQMAELVARVKLHLRRAKTEQTSIAHAQSRTRATAAMSATAPDGSPANLRYLTSTESRLLDHLQQHAPRPCSRAELLRGVWGSTSDHSTNVVDVYIKRLRSKLPDNTIETIRNFGYRIVS